MNWFGTRIRPRSSSARPNPYEMFRKPAKVDQLSFLPDETFSFSVGQSPKRF
jgi:hypothetical protein